MKKRLRLLTRKSHELSLTFMSKLLQNIMQRLQAKNETQLTKIFREWVTNHARFSKQKRKNQKYEQIFNRDFHIQRFRIKTFQYDAI